jgi:phosphoglucomutase
MNHQSIAFGTSGWRARYHQGFNQHNVALVCQAIADEVKKSPKAANGVAVGYDVRFMGQDFARQACEVLAGNGVKALFSTRDVPTPALSHVVISRGLAGAVNFTASHNPYEYNGIKFSPESGGPALPETTRRIEARIAALQDTPEVQRMDFEKAVQKGLVEELDARPSYFAAVKALVKQDELANFKGAKRVAVDCKFGVARGYLDELLSEAGVGVITLHGAADPYFGHDHPEPSQGHLDRLQAFVRENHDVCVGLACDGDADRFGVVDGDGTFVEANVILALLLDYLVQSRGWKGGVARSVATTHLVDRVARAHGLELHETPVGFKFIGDLLIRGEIVFGGEESAGLTIHGHLPEKDGILACLLVAEMIAATGHTLHELVEALFQRVGAVYDRRIGLRLTPEMAAAFDAKIAEPPATLAGKQVERVDRTDGTKLYLEGDEWVLLRKSGTEPMVRIYAESHYQERLTPLLEGCKTWLQR